LVGETPHRVFLPGASLNAAMLKAPRYYHWLLIFGLSIIWGFGFYLIAIALRSFPPLTLVTLRLIFGAFTLVIVMRIKGLSLPRERLWWGYFSLLALMGNLLPFSLIAWAETKIPSSQAGLIMALMPITTMVLSHYLVAHERLTLRRTSGVLLGFCGVMVLMAAQVNGMGGGSLWPQLACVLATVAYAVNSVYVKRLPEINGLVAGAGTLLAGSLLLAPVALVIDQPWTLEVSVTSWMAIVALGAVATGLATWIFFVVIHECGPNFLSIINYIIPAISFAAGVVLLSEPASLSQFAGLTLICMGIAISQPRNRRKRRSPET
jgi:drug/metabolite transporter (DMT)-like permease